MFDLPTRYIVASIGPVPVVQAVPIALSDQKGILTYLAVLRSYFEWRRDYEVVFLNGLDHDELERPWGFCQLCRLTQLKPRPTFIIPDMGE